MKFSFWIDESFSFFKGYQIERLRVKGLHGFRGYGGRGGLGGGAIDLALPWSPPDLETNKKLP